jgi:hypothetical protein
MLHRNMSLLRRSLLVAASPVSLAHARRSFAALPLSPSRTPFSARAHPVTSTMPTPQCIHARAFSSAPGTGSGAQASSDDPKTSGDGGSRAEEEEEGGAVRKRSTKGFKWLAALALGIGATIGFAKDDLENGDWSAGVCGARAWARARSDASLCR